MHPRMGLVTLLLSVVSRRAAVKLFFGYYTGTLKLRLSTPADTSYWSFPGVDEIRPSMQIEHSPGQNGPASFKSGRTSLRRKLAQLEGADVIPTGRNALQCPAPGFSTSENPTQGWSSTASFSSDPVAGRYLMSGGPFGVHNAW
ncbi:N-acetylglutamate synthase [Anopheles sinensis]|uniref:N-acetylglutamate synthase n=1 Tax=Anopheles sinensis TaxID=74873 RepID=A0A084VH49_ANOSI|nr:N-acetylglutamate synthase [Anopheles sinensis]